MVWLRIDQRCPKRRHELWGVLGCRHNIVIIVDFTINPVAYNWHTSCLWYRAMQQVPVQLSVRNVRKSFAGKAGEVRVLDDLSFSINERDFVSIIGPSGCGKTTIFNIIAGLIEPDSGSIH